MKVIKALAATLLAAGLLTSVEPAGASAAEFETYIGCGTAATAPPAHSCPQKGQMGLFFKSLDATVFVSVCVKFPSGKRLCSETVEAKQGELHRQLVHSAFAGRLRATWFVEGNPIASKVVKVTTPPFH